MLQLLHYIDVQSVLLFLVVFLLAYLYWTTRLPKNFPPGPWRVPIFGNMILFGRNRGRTDVVMQDLIKQYGPVVGLKFGSYPVVLLSGLEVIKEAFIKKADVFSSRPSWMFFPQKVFAVNGKMHGLVFGDSWKTLRRFTLISFRDLGVGKKSIEEKIQEEADFVCRELQTFGSKPTDVATLLQEAVGNIICSICFGSRFEYDDPEFLNLMRMLKENFGSGILTSTVNFIPLLQLIPGQGGLKGAYENVKKRKAFIRKKIDEHRETFNPDEVRDFLDLFLKYELKGDSENSFDVRDIENLTSSLFAAGTDTTSTTFRWLFLYMMHYPDVQKKCHQELDEVIGSERRPCLSDRANMPYIMATIQEVQRLGNTTPTTLPHSLKESTTLCGHSIPKNTIVFACLDTVHMDPNYWDNPEEFCPERWIGPDGKLEKKEAFMPFSTGPRTCVGEMLAKSELFIIFTSLMQKFTFKMADPGHPPSLEGHMGISHAPGPYEVVIQER